MELSKEKKDNVIGFRINNSFYNKLEELSSKQNEKKSNIVRKALSFYLNFQSSPFPMILWGRNEFGLVLDFMKEEKLQELAFLSYKNGIKSLDSMLETYSIKNESNFKLGINMWLNILIDYSVSPKLFNWFDSIEWSWIKKPKKILRIIGNHSINKNFSLYSKFLFTYYLKDYNLQLSKEVLLEDMLILEFTSHKNKTN
ncbi:MAG: hypothetical protein ACFFBP_01080 [Promethearchaeota archaeon]